MSRKKVPVKTSHGTQEIKARALGLAPRIRTALLLVDGVRSVAELENLMMAAGVTPGALQLLLDKGLIRFHEEKPEATALEALPEAGSSILNPTILIPQPAFAEKSVVEPSVEVAATVAVATTVVLGDTAPPEPGSARESAVVAPPAPSAAPQPLPAAQVAAAEEAKPAAAVEVVTLLELEAILGDATNVEMETILGVATKLEATPTQAVEPKSAVKEPSVEQPAPSVPPVTHDYWTPGAGTRVIPAAVSRMNLMAARAHLANALDLYLEVGGYALKQVVVASESRAELEQLFLLVESTLRQRIDKPAAALVMDIARELLDR
jgi:hypothetical protein